METAEEIQIKQFFVTSFIAIYISTFVRALQNFNDSKVWMQVNIIKHMCHKINVVACCFKVDGISLRSIKSSLHPL